MIFNNIFNHIYVINLEESINRKNHIIDEFKRVGIEKYEFFKATKHDSEEVEKLMKSGIVKKFPNCFRCGQKRCSCENNFLTPYQIGNWCSFINVFNDIIKNDYKFVLICEDDIVFSHQYNRIINKLMSLDNFKKYNIQMNKPLLIRMGTAFNPLNHNSRNEPIFIKNYALCNPCFAINKEMAYIYLYYLKIIDYHSDIYFHRKIPKNIQGIQHFTMYPYPVYELSFVKEKQKFESLVRPVNSFRRMEYKEYLILYTNDLLIPMIKLFIRNLKMDISFLGIGYNGNVLSYIFMDENQKKRYYFKNKILLIDDKYDIQIIKKRFFNNNIYSFLVKKIEEIYNIKFYFDKDNNDIFEENIKLFYDYLLKLYKKEENLIIVNVNDKNNIFINNIYYHYRNLLSL
jgi:GR25 family glycosyltransferase involved in LPS biosynthesis